MWVSGIRKYLPICVWLFWFSIFSRFICIDAYIRTLFLLWLNNIPFYEWTTFCLSNHLLDPGAVSILWFLQIMLHWTLAHKLQNKNVVSVGDQLSLKEQLQETQPEGQGGTLPPFDDGEMQALDQLSHLFKLSFSFYKCKTEKVGPGCLRCPFLFQKLHSKPKFIFRKIPADVLSKLEYP